MALADYTIRTATRAEVDVAVDWAAAEGWNPGLHDAECYHAADPEGFLVGCLGDEIVATIAAVKYGDFGFVGFYIVRPDRRGQGCGMAIWRAALARLAGCTIGLDGVVAQQDNYRKSGFRLAYRNVRYAGRAGGEAPAGVVDLAGLPLATVAAYDRPFFPAPRPAFLRAWLAQPGATALGLPAGDGLAGYGVVRPCREGWKIGPLSADSPAGAETLFRALAAAVPAGAAVYLDTPEVNPAAVALAERHGMKPAFETARMYTGPAPDLPLARIFGVTSFEIG